MKRTGLAVGFQHPTWKEELNFKAVQISSDLLVGPCRVEDVDFRGI